MQPEDISAIVEREIDAAMDFAGPVANAQTALLPILHAVQEENGFIPADALTQIAQALNISQAEVRGALSFYHDFRLEPPGRHVLKLCRAEACQSMGGEDLALHLSRRHGLASGQTTDEGALTVENVYCLGNCALAPAALLDGELVGRVDAQRIDAIVAGARK